LNTEESFNLVDRKLHSCPHEDALNVDILVCGFLHEPLYHVFEIYIYMTSQLMVQLTSKLNEV